MSDRWPYQIEEDETVNEKTQQVMEVANPAERAAAGVDPGPIGDGEEGDRWAGFSDEELQALREMSSQRSTSQSLDQARRRINVGVQEEQRRREDKQSSYRGPGRYRHASGEVYEVLGVAVGGSSDPRVVVVRHSSGSYYYETEENFESPVYGQRRYEYLGPPQDATAAVDYALRPARRARPR